MAPTTAYGALSTPRTSPSWAGASLGTLAAVSGPIPTTLEQLGRVTFHEPG
ncbi:hypothetical protein [Streptomyces bicolor]|uniref:hypothetical protein n=1 Tax=Streptomyces bicolor TaxID=66874 RepID=UPI000B13ACC2|nr:hypothetical protein [Streptomyces bicolor]